MHGLFDYVEDRFAVYEYSVHLKVVLEVEVVGSNGEFE